MVENPYVSRPVSESMDSPELPAGDPTLPIPGTPARTDRPEIHRLPPVTLSEPTESNSGELARVNTDPARADAHALEVEMPSSDFADVPPPSEPVRVARQSPPKEDITPYEPQQIVATQPAGLFAPSSAELTSQLLPAVQRACDLAQRGALYAAKTEFIHVIRRVAQAVDAERNIDAHSRALAEGLRALEESADFVPTGSGLEGDLDVAIAASSHRTPVVRELPAAVAPHTAVALYHAYAQERLTFAVAGQQAGSMALFGLGKAYSRLADANEQDLLATRGALTMYSAAVTACPSNHLAANELAVLLCRAGHPAEAARLFEQTIDQAPTATAYHNLAIAQQKLGLIGQAVANQQEADRLALWERSTGAVSRRAGVQWVAPEQFAQAAPPAAADPVTDRAIPAGLPTAQNAPPPVPNTAAPIAPKSPLQKVAQAARSITLPGGKPDPAPAAGPATVPAPRPAPAGVPPRTSPSVWF
jgi:tetratricopeptide (TPR) repeat protein